jgi:hypothetical protein
MYTVVKFFCVGDFTHFPKAGETLFLTNQPDDQVFEFDGKAG